MFINRFDMEAVMGLRKILERKSAAPSTPPEDRTVSRTLQEFLGLLRSSDGGMTDYRSQLMDGYASNPYVCKCVDLRATAVSSLTPVLYDQDGNEIEDRNHPLARLLRRPNPSCTWSELVYSAQADYALSGNAFIQKVDVIDGMGELWSIPSGDVIAVPSNDYYAPVAYWQVSGQGMTARFGPDELIHMHTIVGTDRIMGISPLQSAGLSITQQTEARRWNVALMRNGAKPSIVIRVPNAMTQSQFEQFKKRLDARHAGENNAGSTMVLDDGKDISTAGFNARDMDYSTGVTTSAKEIAIAMSVPPELIGDSANKTYSNAQEANKEFAQHTVVPLADRFYSKLSWHLCPLYPDVARIGYDEQEIDALKGDESALISALESCEFLTVNEKRARLSYGDVEGGDVLMVSGTKMPLSEASLPVSEIMRGADGES